MKRIVKFIKWFLSVCAVTLDRSDEMRGDLNHYFEKRSLEK